MSDCRLNFTKKENGIAFDLYQGLIKDGVSCADMDVGYSEINYAGIHCPDKSAKSCMKGERDGVVSPEEVFEYGLNSYEKVKQDGVFEYRLKYQRLLESVLDRSIPWVLDDLDPATPFDADIRKRVQAAIDVLKGILKKNRLVEGSEEYKEKMAVGLYCLSVAPDAVTINLSEKNKKYFEELVQDLEKAGIGEFKSFLKEKGGFFLKSGDYSHEYSALEALNKEEGECSESAKILFAIFKMAELEPVFIYDEIRREKINRPEVVESLKTLPPSMDHVCVGLRFNKRLRLFDSSLHDSDAKYKYYYPLSLRQFLAFDSMYSNLNINQINIALTFDKENPFIFYAIGNLETEKGKFNSSVDAYTKAISIYPDYAIAYNNRGGSFFMLGRQKDALADVDMAIKLEPNLGLPYFTRGLIRKQNGALDKAIEDFKKAIQNEPNMVGAYFNLGVSQLATNKESEAIKNLAQFLKMSPNSAVDLFNFLEDELNKTWEGDKRKKQTAEAFLAETTNTVSRSEAFFLVSYIAWEAGYLDDARRLFSKIANGMKFEQKPSKSTVKFLGDMIKLMPKTMVEDKEVKVLIEKIKEKMK